MMRKRQVLLEVPQPLRKKQVSTEYITQRYRNEKSESQYDKRIKEHLEKYKQKETPPFTKRAPFSKACQFQFPLPKELVYKEPEPINYVREKAKSIIEGERKAMALGPSFIKYYYSNFDDMNMQQRYTMMAQVYCTQTKMTYNGKVGYHQEEAMKMAMKIPPVVKRNIKHIDTQPYLSTNAAVMISVTGDIQLMEQAKSERKQRPFVENFILMPFGKNKYYIQHHQLRIF